MMTTMQLLLRLSKEQQQPPWQSNLIVRQKMEAEEAVFSV
jgi:hypothetical protein